MQSRRRAGRGARTPRRERLGHFPFATAPLTLVDGPPVEVEARLAWRSCNAAPMLQVTKGGMNICVSLETTCMCAT
jgi:hypothetical protein